MWSSPWHRKKEDTEFWQYRLARFLAGKISDEQYLAAAKRPHMKLQLYRSMGMRYLADKNVDDPRKYFQMAIKQNQKNIYDHTLVAADLASMGGD